MYARLLQDRLLRFLVSGINDAVDRVESLRSSPTTKHTPQSPAIPERLPTAPFPLLHSCLHRGGRNRPFSLSSLSEDGSIAHFSIHTHGTFLCFSIVDCNSEHRQTEKKEDQRKPIASVHSFRLCIHCENESLHQMFGESSHRVSVTVRMGVSIELDFSSSACEFHRNERRTV